MDRQEERVGGVEVPLWVCYLAALDGRGKRRRDRGEERKRMSLEEERKEGEEKRMRMGDGISILQSIN